MYDPLTDTRAYTSARDANVCVHKLIKSYVRLWCVPKYGSANFDDAVVIDSETSGLHVVEKHQILGTVREAVHMRDN